MVRFIFDLATEGKNDNEVCGKFTADESKLEDGKRIIQELKNPVTTMKIDGPEQELYFNGVNISEEAEMWIEAFINGNYKSLGFIFADTLDKHSFLRQANPRI